MPTHRHLVLELVPNDSAAGNTIHFPALMDLCHYLRRLYPAWAPTIGTWLEQQIASGEIHGTIVSIWRVEVDGEGYRIPTALFPPRMSPELAAAVRTLTEVR